MRKLFFCFFFILSLSLKAQLVNLDPSYGTNGVATVDFGQEYDAAVSSTMQVDGKILLCGTIGFASDSRISLARLLPNGQPDLNFGTNGKTVITYDTLWGHIPKQISVQSDGKILVAFLLNENNETRRMLVRLLPNGSIDTGFGVQGFYKTSWPRGEGWTGFKILPDGKILCYGTNSELFDGLYYGRIVGFRLLPTGRLDSSFNGSQYKVYRLLNTGASRENGLFLGSGTDQSDVLFSTSQNPVGGLSTSYLQKIKPNGNPDSSFGTYGVQRFNFTATGTTVTVVGVHLLPTGQIRLPGLHRINNFSMQTPTIFGMLADGRIDSSFGTIGMARYQIPNTANFNNYLGVDLKQDNQGRYYLAYAGYTSLSTSRVFAVTRFLENGSSDLSYGNSGSISTNIPGVPQRIFLDPADGLPILTGQTNLSTIAQGDDMVAMKIKLGTVSSLASLEKELLPYPNPIQQNGWLFIPETVNDAVLQLTDPCGRVILLSSLPQRTRPGGKEYQMEKLPSGLYFLTGSGLKKAQPIFILP